MSSKWENNKLFKIAIKQESSHMLCLMYEENLNDPTFQEACTNMNINIKDVYHQAMCGDFELNPYIPESPPAELSEQHAISNNKGFTMYIETTNDIDGCWLNSDCQRIEDAIDYSWLADKFPEVRNNYMNNDNYFSDYDEEMEFIENSKLDNTMGMDEVSIMDSQIQELAELSPILVDTIHQFKTCIENCTDISVFVPSRKRHILRSDTASAKRRLIELKSNITDEDQVLVKKIFLQDSSSEHDSDESEDDDTLELATVSEPGSINPEFGKLFKEFELFDSNTITAVMITTENHINIVKQEFYRRGLKHKDLAFHYHGKKIIVHTKGSGARKDFRNLLYENKSFASTTHDWGPPKTNNSKENESNPSS